MSLSPILDDIGILRAQRLVCCQHWRPVKVEFLESCLSDTKSEELQLGELLNKLPPENTQIAADRVFVGVAALEKLKRSQVRRCLYPFSSLRARQLAIRFRNGTLE